MTSRWDRIRERRVQKPLEESEYTRRLRYLCARLFRGEEGQEFLALLDDRYVSRPSDEAASESALRADAVIRNLVLTLQRFTHEGPLNATRSGTRSPADTRSGANTGA